MSNPANPEWPMLEVAAPLTTTLAVKPETDHYYVHVQDGHRYMAQLVGVGDEALPYAIFSVYNETVSIPDLMRANDTRTVAGQTSVVTWQVVPGLDYVIEVANDSYAVVNGVQPIGAYKLLVTEVALDDYSDLRSQATALPLGQRTNATFDLPSDRDQFKVNLTAGVAYTYIIRSAGETPVHAPLASIFNEQGLPQSSTHSGTERGVFTGTFTPTVTGNYYLETSFNRFQDVGNLVGGGYTIEILAPGTSLPAPNLNGIQTGGASNDSFLGGSGDDLVRGAGGIDTVYYDGLRSNYSLTRLTDGSWRVTDLHGKDGTDTLTGIERIYFSGTKLALDLDGNAGTTAKILGALFGPRSLRKEAYVGIGLSLFDSGMSYEDVLNMAVHSPAFQQLAGSSSNTDFVRLVYKNVTGVAPTAAALKDYVDLLDKGVYTQTSLAMLAAESDQNAMHIDLIGLAETGIEYFPA